MYFFFFFFSSRRRHTRSLRDWSSDVCSSDLVRATKIAEPTTNAGACEARRCPRPARRAIALTNPRESPKRMRAISSTTYPSEPFAILRPFPLTADYGCGVRKYDLAAKGADPDGGRVYAPHTLCRMNSRVRVRERSDTEVG